MDIKVKRIYYHRKGLDGLHHIHLREEIFSPMLKVTQLELSFADEADADEFVKVQNETAIESTVTA